MTRSKIIALLCGLFVVTAGAAADTAVGPKLPARLRALLVEEMRALERASAQIVSAIAAGEHEKVAEAARHIHESFILAGELTERDRHELELALPRAFLELDGAFHRTALRLAEAAHRRDGELEVYYFGRMLEMCQSCHRRFAADRFPAWRTAPPPAAHSH